MRENILSMIDEILQVPPGTVTVQTKASDLEQWDSLAHVLIIGGLEERFGICIPLEEAVELESVAEILERAGV